MSVQDTSRLCLPEQTPYLLELDAVNRLSHSSFFSQTNIEGWGNIYK
jgi:hypothetical protein